MLLDIKFETSALNDFKMTLQTTRPTSFCDSFGALASKMTSSSKTAGRSVKWINVWDSGDNCSTYMG